MFGRKSIRLKGYDYAQEGLYFITICCQNKMCLLGEVINHQMKLNLAGEMVEKWYWGLEQKFPTIKCHQMVIMPNHFHCILEITESQKTLGTIIQWFKTMTTNEYIRGVKYHNWQEFDKRFWQRNYYEHIIRNERAYSLIVDYIENNPLKWQNDSLH